MSWSQLHVAAESGDQELAHTALAEGVNVNVKDDGDQTPLHRAAGFGHANMIKLLFASNADLHATDEAGSTALHLAAWQGQVDATVALLESSANVDARGLYGDTPLHLASSYGQVKAAEALLNRKADANAKDNSGKTPMDWAKDANNSHIVSLLVRHGGMQSIPGASPRKKLQQSDDGHSAQEEEHMLKILVVGDTGTGKTTFIKRYASGIFVEKYKATIGVDFALKTHIINNMSVTVQLWDIAGQERFGAMTHVYYKEAVAAMIMFDCTRKDTFDSVKQWKGDIDDKVMLSDDSPIPVLLVGTKSDLLHETKSCITPKDLELYAKSQGYIGAFTCSSKNGDGVSEAAEKLVTVALERVQCVDTGLANDSIRIQDGDEEARCCEM
eukprot:m.20232 g.20232  ORF g.20232 m.20232 type:complete len:385 (-) comp12822_c0_seq1:277-1431(-)